MNIPIDANALLCYLIGRIRFPEIQAGIDYLRICKGHLPERILDYDRRVHAHTQFKEQDMQSIMAAQELVIALGCSVPAFVLDKGVICSEVHAHGLAADRTLRHKFRRNTHILLSFKHRPDGLLVVIGLLVARLTALPETVVALCIEETVLVKSCLLKLVVNIGGENKIFLVLHKLKQALVCAVVHVHIAVDVNVA